MILLFDIGGTKMRLALSEDEESFGEPQIVPTPQNFEEAISQFQDIAKELTNGNKLRAASGGVPGPFDASGTLGVLPNLQQWQNQPLTSRLQQALGANVYLGNDADLVGLGESVVGAGKDHEIVAYLTISTGVGGARIVHGKIDTSAMGFEPGHQVLDMEGKEPCGCGGQGHLESLISGSALERKYQKSPKDITDPEIWEEAAKVLAFGLNNVIVHWSPDIIVLGGSIVLKEPGISIDAVRENVKGILKIFPEAPPIVKATLGDLGGLHGALTFAKQQLS